MRPDVVALARGWIGTPYLHQGAHKGVGTDCLGLILGVAAQLGTSFPAEVPPYSMFWNGTDTPEALWQAAATHLMPRALGQAASGDVLLFRMRQSGPARHLGIDTGENTFIHAYSRHSVLETALSLPWARRIVARFAFPPVKKD